MATINVDVIIDIKVEDFERNVPLTDKEIILRIHEHTVTERKALTIAIKKYVQHLLEEGRTRDDY